MLTATWLKEVVIVSTDIDEPTDIPFAKADPPDPDDKGDAYPLNANAADGDENFQSLTFIEAHGGLAMLTDSRASVPAPAGTVRLTGVDDEVTKDVKENEYSCTFEGAEGTFTCTETGGCDVTPVLDGEITNMANVHFTPDEDVTVEEDDADYPELRLLAGEDDRRRWRGPPTTRSRPSQWLVGMDPSTGRGADRFEGTRRVQGRRHSESTSTTS